MELLRKKNFLGRYYIKKISCFQELNCKYIVTLNNGIKYLLRSQKEKIDVIKHVLMTAAKNSKKSI